MEAPARLPGEAAVSATTHHIVTCNHGCGLRYPATKPSELRTSCPRCGGPVTISEHAYSPLTPAAPSKGHRQGSDISILVDNVRSIFNVGSIFRCADGAGVGHIYLCGISPTPEHPKMSKTSLGSERSIPWSYHANSIKLASAMANRGYAIWALDTMKDSESLFDIAAPPPDARIILAVGNELTGLDPLLLPLCERGIRIPMAGQKRSLNVAIALGIAIYWLRGQYCAYQR